MIGLPRPAGLPALATGLVLLLWSAVTAGGGRTLLAVGIGLGVLGAGLTPFRWPGTAATLLAVGAQVTATPSVGGALITGLLVALYLLLRDGVLPLAGWWPIGAGAAMAVLAVLGALALAPGARLGWVLAACTAAPLLLWILGTGAARVARGR